MNSDYETKREAAAIKYICNLTAVDDDADAAFKAGADWALVFLTKLGRSDKCGDTGSDSVYSRATDYADKLAEAKDSEDVGFV